MNDVIRRLWLWLWLLLPANPILVRVVAGASRRVRHLWLRTIYLFALLVVVLFSLFAFMGGEHGGSLTDLAKGASQTFKFASITQLALMCFLAPVFTAAAITQERDAQTFNILLSTPLTNAQIVFGSLVSRLFFVILLLLAGLPIFIIMTAYGGVTTSQIFVSFAISGSTAILTSSLAIFISMVRVGTRGTIFTFYLMIGLYLLSLYLLGGWDQTWIEASAANVDEQKMSWLTPLHPFLALDVALNRVYPPPYKQLTDYSGWVRYALAYPAAFYVIWTLMAAFLLTVGSIFFVRRAAKTGEQTFLTRITDRFRKVKTGERTRTPRHVWSNPVAWREAKTRASTGGLLRWTLILGGIGATAYLFLAHVSGDFPTDKVRTWLAAMIIIQFAIAVIIATNTAATSMTKEKESKTMDLLLITPLTSKYILWGKLRGLVSFVVPLVLGPVVVLLAFGLYGSRNPPKPPVVWLETALEMAALILVYTAFACVIGLRVSLLTRKNVTAVMASIGLVILLFGVATMIGMAVVRGSGGDFGAFLAPFAPFTSIWYLIDPMQLFDSASDYQTGASGARVAAAMGSAIATAVYAFIVWSIYISLVRNFDMIVRKQSGT